MEIIKQLSEDEFVIKMNDTDLKDYDSIVVAHDYVAFSSNSGISTGNKFEGELYGKYKSCGNWIKARHIIQIGIRDIIKFILPMLNKHENCQPEHLVRDGLSVYKYGESKIVFFENGVQKIALRKDGSENYNIIDFDVYMAIKDGEF